MKLDIRLKNSLLPFKLRVQTNPRSTRVLVERLAVLGRVGFIQLTAVAASQFAELLDLAANNASASPVALGEIGEIEGVSQRRLGVTEVRIRLTVKHAGKIEFEVREQIRGLGTKPRYSTPSISSPEASKFGEAIRTAKAQLESVG